MCKVVVDELSIETEALAQRIGLPLPKTQQILRELTGEGVLRVNGHFVSLKDGARARSLALAADELPPRVESRPAPAPAPQRLAIAAPATPPVKKQRAPAKDMPGLPGAFAVEKNVPLPDPGRRARPLVWPFEQMAVGDSFNVDVPDGSTTKELFNRLRRDAETYHKRTPQFSMAIRTALDGKSMRVWRVERKVRGKKT